LVRDCPVLLLVAEAWQHVTPTLLLINVLKRVF
jgi:hypothetical protein